MAKWIWIDNEHLGKVLLNIDAVLNVTYNDPRGVTYVTMVSGEEFRMTGDQREALCKAFQEAGLFTPIIDECEKREEGIAWTPISSGMPPANDYYLTTTEYGEVYLDYYDGHEFNRTEHVIAYAPRPKPYKEE